jgi:hypothetical protein
MLVGRILLTIVKVFLIVVVTAMIRFQIPELRYDLGPREPVSIVSPNDLSPERFAQSTFASVRGRPDLTKAAKFAMHGVPFTYFLLEEYGTKLVVRAPEEIDEQWVQIDRHLGRLRPYRRMPFSRSVRAGFRKHFDIGIPANAMFLARDDVPRPSGWSIGAVIFASVLWCVLVYFFFIHRRLFPKRATPAPQPDESAS